MSEVRQPVPEPFPWRRTVRGVAFMFAVSGFWALTDHLLGNVELAWWREEPAFLSGIALGAFAVWNAIRT